VTVDSFDEASPTHRKLAIRYQLENPFVDEAGALLATQFEADRDQEESDRKDEELRAMMDRLYPEFQKHHDEYARAIAEGRTPPMPGRRGEGPRHPSPNPPRPPGPEPGPEIHAPMPPPPPADLGQAAERFLRDAGGRISERHAAQALAYQRANPCSWAEAVYLTRGG
jgi:hypothetical protein